MMRNNFTICYFFILFLLLLSASPLFAQNHLKPGFNKQEYLDLLTLSERFGDKDKTTNINIPQDYHYVYRSPEMGLKNEWELWQRKDSVAVICLRGTINDNISWMENFYCGMVPANGSIQLGPSDTFQYQLSSYPNAYVHIGWLIGLGYLSRDIQPRIDSLYHAGIKDFIVTGHSQGGALSFLVTAWMRQLIANNRLAKDIRIKTYSSAAPKPGNIYFAYDYENATRDGWAYNVVNTADWVPETPVSLQTLNDFNITGPFTDADKFIKKQPFPRNIVLKAAYNKMNRSSKKAVKTYDHYLGGMAGKIVRNYLPGYVQPKFIQNSYYVRAGYQITLRADTDYYKHFPDSKTNLFVHHDDNAYRYLINKYYQK